MNKSGFKFWTIPHIISILIIILIIILGIEGYKSYNGPTLSSNSRVGYYGHKRLKSFSAQGLNERNAASKIYLKKSQIDWDTPIKSSKDRYYFPKNMPKYTRRYIVVHHLP